jgi:hypothetical protein
MQQGLVGPFVYIQNEKPIVVEMWSIVCKIQLFMVFYEQTWSKHQLDYKEAINVLQYFFMFTFNFNIF